ncbi:hypothetical protein ACTJJ0_22210 [Chitinophaga sp. 22321]
MSQSFRLKFDQMRDGDPTNRETSDPVSGEGSDSRDESYSGYSNVRNVCFAWPDGRKLFLNYAYLVSCDYQPEENTLSLTWTTHTVMIKGFSLHNLFDELMQHLPRQIVCTDPRYNATVEKDKSIVNEIHITANS